jgi:hypothetical protein
VCCYAAAGSRVSTDFILYCYTINDDDDDDDDDDGDSDDIWTS